MEVSGDSLDAVLFDLYQALLNTGARNIGTRGGTTEMLALSIRITKPRARLSRSESRGKAFSPLGELLWYLAKSDKLDFIEPYVGEYRKDAVNGVLPGAYGPRLFAMRGENNQIENVIRLLRKKSGSRRAVVQLFNAEDIATEHTEIPCTTTLQFHLREGMLSLSVTMRSNDAVWGLPHDVFCFTMIQEMMARALDVELGEYYHFAGSMHIYDKYVEKARQYLGEGFQRTVEMPAMSKGDPFDLVADLLAFETRVRNGAQILAEDAFPDPYWADIARLLQAFWAGSDGQRLDELISEFNSPIYKTYLDGRRK